MTAYFALLFSGVLAGLVLTWWISEYAIDWCIAQWNGRRCNVIPFGEARRASLRRAMGGRS